MSHSYPYSGTFLVFSVVRVRPMVPFIAFEDSSPSTKFDLNNAFHRNL